jgi:hypothetical protein
VRKFSNESISLIFEMKIKTRAVSAKQMSMSTPVQLLLFASDQVDVVEPNLVCLDNWYDSTFILKMF